MQAKEVQLSCTSDVVNRGLFVIVLTDAPVAIIVFLSVFEINHLLTI